MRIQSSWTPSSCTYTLPILLSLGILTYICKLPVPPVWFRFIMHSAPLVYTCFLTSAYVLTLYLRGFRFLPELTSFVLLYWLLWFMPMLHSKLTLLLLNICIAFCDLGFKYPCIVSCPLLLVYLQQPLSCSYKFLMSLTKPLFCGIIRSPYPIHVYASGNQKPVCLIFTCPSSCFACHFTWSLWIQGHAPCPCF